MFVKWQSRIEFNYSSDRLFIFHRNAHCTAEAHAKFTVEARIGNLLNQDTSVGNAFLSFGSRLGLIQSESDVYAIDVVLHGSRYHEMCDVFVFQHSTLNPQSYQRICRVAPAAR
jgi:hypothetical protein